MFCSQCGQKLEVGANVCPSCQAAVGKPMNGKKLDFPGRTGKDTSEPAGLIAALSDFSFESFITLEILKLLYMICVGIAGLLTFTIIFAGFRVGSGTGMLFLLVVGPLFFLLSAICSRVLLEMIAVLFSIQAYTGELVKQGRRRRD